MPKTSTTTVYDLGVDTSITTIGSSTLTNATWYRWAETTGSTIRTVSTPTGANNAWIIWAGSISTTSSTATGCNAWIDWAYESDIRRYKRELQAQWGPVDDNQVFKQRMREHIRSQHPNIGAPGEARVPYTPRKKTDAEVQQEVRRALEFKRQEDERLAKEAAAKQRAEKLLLDNLTPEQREELVQKKCFHLYTASGRKYRIERYTHGNIFLLDEKGTPVRKLCAQPAGVPVDDAILAQKLALESDEESFLKVANGTNLRH